MKKLTVILAASAIAFSATAHAAGYIKFDGVDGEAKSTEWSGANTVFVTTEDDPQTVGLLLPAVQKVREAARPTRGSRSRTVDEFEIEDGGRRYTLHDAQIEPTNDPYTVEINFRCKTWEDMRSGRKGGDCTPRAAKGKVEATWKVEEGVK